MLRPHVTSTADLGHLCARSSVISYIPDVASQLFPSSDDSGWHVASINRSHSVSSVNENKVLICIILFFSVLSWDLYFGFINMAIAFIIAYFFMAGGLWAVHNEVHEK